MLVITSVLKHSRLLFQVIALLSLFVVGTVSAAATQTVQQRIDDGESPFAIFQSNNSLLNEILGATYQQGIIIDLDVSNGRGLLSTPVDMAMSGHSAAIWMNADIGQFQNTGASDTALYTGNKNTVKILRKLGERAGVNSGYGGYNYAAYIAKKKNAAQYLASQHWYLPSLNELHAVIEHAVGINSGACSSSGYQNYWSSSEASTINAYMVNCFDNSASGSFITTRKNNPHRIRLVRQFTRAAPVVSTTIPALVRGNIHTGASVNNASGAGISEVGLCYDTITTPTINDACKISTLNSNVFSVGLPVAALQSDTKFYLRAYVITERNGVIYGNQETYTTPEGTVGTNTVAQRLASGESPFTIAYSNPQLVTELHGESYLSGKIAYLNLRTNAGFVVTSTDQSSSAYWTNMGVGLVRVALPENEIGSGYQNTGKILARLGSPNSNPQPRNYNYAAYLAKTYSTAHDGSWYLPSTDELIHVMSSGALNGCGSDYWAANEDVSLPAIYGVSVACDGVVGRTKKSATASVRLIRGFSRVEPSLITNEIGFSLNDVLLVGHLTQAKGGQIKEAGFVYSTTEQPQVFDQKIIATIADGSNSHINLNASLVANTLTVNTPTYVRSFAVTASNEVVYGNLVSFTPAPLIELTASEPSAHDDLITLSLDAQRLSYIRSVSLYYATSARAAQWTRLNVNKPMSTHLVSMFNGVLSPSTTYYVYAKAAGDNRKIWQSATISFSTAAVVNVSVVPVKENGQKDGVLLSGSLTDHAKVKHAGFVYGRSSLPSIGNGTELVSARTNFSEGAFNMPVLYEELIPGAKYNMRAFAKVTSYQTLYSPTVESFYTPPVVKTTTPVTSGVKVVTGGTVITQDIDAVKSFGVCYFVSGHSVDEVCVSGSRQGYEVQIDLERAALPSETAFDFRAYVRTEKFGMTYGDTVVYTTPVGTYCPAVVANTLTLSPEPSVIGVDDSLDTMLVNNRNGALTYVGVLDNSIRNATAYGGGGSGFQAALNQTTDRVYVTSAESNYVWILSVTNMSLIAKVLVEESADSRSGIKYLAINEKTNKIIVLNVNRKTMLEIDGVNNSIGQRFSFSYTPSKILVNEKSNKIYVSDEDSIHIINGATYKLIKTLGVASPTVSLAMNESANKVYAALGNNNLLEIGGVNNNLGRAVAIGHAARSLLVNESMNMIYVESTSSNSVWVVSGTTFNVIGQIGNSDRGDQSLALNAESNMLYITHAYDGTLTIVDPGTYKVIRTLKVGTSPSSVEVDEQADRVFVGNYGSDTVSVVNGCSYSAP